MFTLNSLGILAQKPLQEPPQSTSCIHTVEAAAAQPGQRGCKRKRDADDKNIVHGAPFTIETQLGGLPFPSTTLSPLLVIPRSCLPLAFLDLAGNFNRAPGTQLFSARLSALDSVLQGNFSDHPVLIARACSVPATLYAIERVDTGLYALCSLGNWVTIEALEQLQAASANVIAPKKARHERVDPQDSDWWRDLAIKDDGAVQLESRRRETEIPRNVRLCLKARPAAENRPVLDTLQLPLSITREPIHMIVDGYTNGASHEPSTQTTEGLTNEEQSCLLPIQSTEDVLSMLRSQYQENLYISKTSLAYFAKGPLSRARASLHNKAASSASLPELATHLRSSIMSTATMDKKYKEAIPSIINTLPADTLAEDDVTTVVAELQKKLRKTKKPKIGKDGLYPGEELNISRWWLSRDAFALGSESQDNAEDSMRASLLELRARETQMQIIFLLEALALEASMPAAQTNNIAPKAASEWENEASHTKKRKVKKPQDLHVLLDLFVDRLCIWQSMRMDDSNLNKAAGAQPSASDHGGIGTDALKNFCVDVVLPFYGSRLPETSNMLRQKLGGHKTPSPMRPPLVKAASSSQLAQKPGTAMQRSGVRKARATLERVLTDEKSASQRRAPGLSRSKTDSALPGLNREVSDTSLTAISLNRVALHKSKRYSQREVDLNGVSQAVEAKLKKKASVEQELRGAIATMKEPNPRMAVKELVEAAERRVAGSHSRKIKNPIRNLFAQSVQVMATPKGNRRKDVFGGLPRPPQPTLDLEPEPDEIPPSSVSRVPPSIQKFAVPRSRDHQPPSLARSAQPLAEQTPTRGPSKFAPNLLDPGLGSKADLKFLTPSKPRRSVSASESQTTSDTHNVPQLPVHRGSNPPSVQQSNTNHPKIQETPLKSQARAAEIHKPPTECITITSSPPHAGNDPSIYDTLGWNDFDDLS